MTKSKASVVNAALALIQTFAASVMGLILSQSILHVCGSDYNGVNATVTQIIGMLTLLEGGFTLASNVALFGPFANRDTDRINGILSATRRRFLAVGAIALLIGVLLALLYPLTITSQMPWWMIFCLMLTVLIPTCVNLGFNMKYRVIILTAQKEYVISLISTVTHLFGNGVAIFLIRSGAGLLMARISIMLSLLLGYLLIAVYCKRQYSFVDFKQPPLYEEIKGTKNVVIIKIMSVLYTSLPIIVISMIPGEGTLLASVYAVYKSIVYTVKNSLSSLCAAPRLSFGALLAEGDLTKARKAFEKYEMIACIGLSVVLGATCLLLFPFVELYTAGITDISYRSIPLAVILLSTAFVEILHTPSGQIIQMKGDFKVARNMQAAACAILIVCMGVGLLVIGFLGVVLSVLLATLMLAVVETVWVAKKILNRRLIDFLRNALPCVLILIGCTVIGLSGLIHCANYWYFILWGLVSVLALGVLTLLLYFCVRRRQVLEVLAMLRGVFKRRKSGLQNDSVQ